MLKRWDYPEAKIKEIVVFETGEIGQIHDLNSDFIRIILFSPLAVKVGAKISRTNSQLKIPVKDDFFGQILNPFCTSGTNTLSSDDNSFLPIDISPLSINERIKITKPLITGTAIVDIMLPLGLGQRELILGDRKTGKSTFVLSTIKNQIDNGAVAIYAAIGNKNSDIKELGEFMNADPQRKKNMIVVATSAFESPGLIFLTPFTAMTLAEYFRDQGRNVLVIMDDLLTHAKFYREFSLLAESFPGRDSYPGDIFHIHAKLLERAGNFKYIGKGLPAGNQGEVSISCLPTAETQDADLTGYIISNLMSITDGHLFFDNNVYAKGVRPAINTPLSVTRVGKQTQDKVMKDVNRELSALFSVYEKIENLSHFGSELSESVKNTLALGEKIQSFFNQPEGITFPKEVYLVLFCYVWLGFVNTESEIEQARMKLTAMMQNKEEKQFLTDLIRADSFNDLLKQVGEKKDILLKPIN